MAFGLGFYISVSSTESWAYYVKINTWQFLGKVEKCCEKRKDRFFLCLALLNPLSIVRESPRIAPIYEEISPMPLTTAERLRDISFWGWWQKRILLRGFSPIKDITGIIMAFMECFRIPRPFHAITRIEFFSISAESFWL